MSRREQFEAWGMSDPDLSETLKSEVYASIAWMAWQAASKASEQQLAAVVAENGNKSRCLGFFASVIKSGEEWTSVCQHEYSEALKTPATDAYLAEVRAQGVELFVSHMDYPHSPYEFTHGYMDKHAIEFAAKLRKESAL